MNHLLRAVDIVNSWMRSMNLQYEKMGRTFTIDKKKIIVADIENLSEDTLILNYENIISTDSIKIKNEFNKITKQLNISAELPERTIPKLEKSDRYELRYLRAKGFSRAPNPPESLIKKYLPLMRALASNAHRKYFRLAQKIGFEQDDFFSMGLVYLTTFLHSYEHTLEKSTYILCNYINQRYSEWAKWSKNKNVNTVSIYDLPEKSGNFLEYSSLDSIQTLQEENYAEENFAIKNEDGSYSNGKLVPKMAGAELFIDGVKSNKILKSDQIAFIKAPKKNKKIKDVELEHYRQIALEKLPALLTCKKCWKERPKEKVGVKAVRVKGKIYTSRLPYCTTCRGGYRAKNKRENRSSL